jgi:alpha-1,6-mannosyltransferase
MRIVQVANFYTPTSGGLRTCVEELGRGYVADGHERILVVPGEHDLDEQTPSGRRVWISSPRLGGGYRVLTARQRVRRVLDELRPDVLEVSDKFSVPWLARWARKERVPIVLFSHERIDVILRPRVPPWLPLRVAADMVNKRLSRLVHSVIVASEFSAEEFRRIGAGNVRQVALGVDLGVFRPAVTDAPRDGAAVRLVTVGRLSAEKSPELAIECLRVLRAGGLDADLTVVGDGPLRTVLQRRAEGLPVHFTGHIDAREAVARLIAAADIALSPSSAETFGLATLEALACGTPVIVPAAGAARELVTPGASGAVCDGTGEGLARGVRELLAVPAPQRRDAARRAAERYPWSATVASLLDCYESASAPRVRL